MLKVKINKRIRVRMAHANVLRTAAVYQWKVQRFIAILCSFVFADFTTQSVLKSRMQVFTVILVSIAISCIYRAPLYIEQRKNVWRRILMDRRFTFLIVKCF